MSHQTTTSQRSDLLTQLAAHFRTPLYRHGYALIFSAVVTSGLGLLYWVLAARYYSPEVVGVNAAVISVMTFLAGMSRLNLDGVLYRFLPRAGEAARRLIVVAYLISQALALLVGVIFLAGITFWSPSLKFLSASLWIGASFVAMTMATSLFTLQDSALTGLRQTIWIPIENAIFAVAKIALLIMLAQAYPEHGILASWAIAMFALIIPINLLMFTRLIPRHQQESGEPSSVPALGRIAKYVAGIYLGYLATITITGLLPVIVLTQAGSAASAYFYLPWLISSALQLISQNMNISLTVEGALDQSKLAAYTRRVLMQMARLLLPLVILFVLGAPYILSVFGSAYAAEGTWLLRLLALAAIPHVINNVYIGVARVLDHVVSIVLIQGSLCVFGIGLSYLLLPHYGITGVGIAWLGSQSLVALVVLLTRLLPILRSHTARHAI